MMFVVKSVSKKWVMVTVYYDCEVEVATEKKIPVTIKTEKRIPVMMNTTKTKAKFPCTQSLMVRKKDPKGGAAAVTADLRLVAIRWFPLSYSIQHLSMPG